jgi:predicted esterase
LGGNPMALLNMYNSRPQFQDGSLAEVFFLVTRELERSPTVPLSSMYFGGFSMGAGLALWTAYQLPRRPAGLILLSGLALGIQHLPVNPKTCGNYASDVPVYHAHGSGDHTVPMMAANMLQGNIKEKFTPSDYEWGFIHLSYCSSCTGYKLSDNHNCYI